MVTVETELEMVRRHVREGNRRVTAQLALVARLQASSRLGEQARALLVIFAAIQRQHEAHLARLKARPG